VEAAASGKTRVVAVSKTKPVEDIIACYNAGHQFFGENYAQELMEKAQQLPNNIKWHFIGHLQSDKVNKLLRLVPNLDVVESVDSLKLAKALSSARKSNNQGPLKIFLQVNTSGENQKSGLSPNAVSQFVEDILSDNSGSFSHISLQGLMTIGMLGGNTSREFSILGELKKKIQASLTFKFVLPELELSMGMSSDYLEAIRHGSTNVRIGSTIFGAR